MGKHVKMRTYREVREFLDKDTGKKIRVHEAFAEPKPRNKLLAIILKNNKSTIWKWVDRSKEFFSHDNNTYFVDSSGTYLSDNKVLCSTYVEGISTPISHKNIVITQEKIDYIDPMTGEEKTTTVSLINDLKIDSKIVDICLNRHLADEFNKTALDKKGLAIFLLLIANLIVGIGALGGHFV